ncbi:SPOR domain-containing protein [Roseicyclus mahoneyensis]|uniref:Sporulation related protein n=1 Tax=Roseicyclus mahoneyensis TaxID=164332 RepID=A0A316GLM1_9RHOB|nr:SPOR domain-containing protein [Roseicyclus mahoneyensis]PWK61128.1 sporulation related protein [Roseicyclus mahoneyensis]
MADFDYFETDEAHATPRNGAAQLDATAGGPRIGTLVNWAGAVISLGLVIGMVVWAYQLTVRDMSGVPVIRALEGPMRVAPADPGGTQAEHQGLAVNRLAEGAEAAPVPDRLILAPPPVDLDVSALASASAANLVPVTETAAVATESEAPTPAEVAASTQALIERLMDRAEPLGPVSSDTPASVVSASPVPAVANAGESLQIIPASVPGPSRSLRPPSRPATLAALAFSGPATSALAVETVPELEAADLPEGTRLVQLGAFDTPEIARAEWDRLTARFPDYFAGRPRVIQQATSGGSAFYRLRAHGFDDLAASRRFCAVLMAQNAPCIPVTVR